MRTRSGADAAGCGKYTAHGFAESSSEKQLPVFSALQDTPINHGVSLRVFSYSVDFYYTLVSAKKQEFFSKPCLYEHITQKGQSAGRQVCGICTLR